MCDRACLRCWQVGVVPNEIDVVRHLALQRPVIGQAVIHVVCEAGLREGGGPTDGRDNGQQTIAQRITVERMNCRVCSVDPLDFKIRNDVDMLIRRDLRQDAVGVRFGECPEIFSPLPKEHEGAASINCGKSFEINVSAI